jgi:hypothetical protein
VEPVEFLLKTRLVEGVGAVGHFQSKICPVGSLKKGPLGPSGKSHARGC